MENLSKWYITKRINFIASMVKDFDTMNKMKGVL